MHCKSKEAQFTERPKKNFEKTFACEPTPENRKRVLEKLYDLGRAYEKNPCAETARDYHDARDVATEKGFEGLPASPMYAAYDYHAEKLGKPPAGTIRERNEGA